MGGTPSATLTNFDNNISGTGFIEGLVFINHATVETNNVLGAGTLRIVGSAYGGSFDNENSLFADNGGTIELGDWSGTGSSTILDDDGAISLLSTGAVTTIEIANSVTITTTFGDGLIELDGTDPANDRIISNGSSASLTLGLHIEVLNTGTIGDANLTLTNDGDIRATGYTLVISTGAHTITNAANASMEAYSNYGAASYLDLQSAVQNSGSIYAKTNDLVTFDQALTNLGADSSIYTNGGTITFFKSVTNNGGLIQLKRLRICLFLHSRPQRRPDRNRQWRVVRPTLSGTASQGVEFTGAGGNLELDQDAGQIGTDISGLTVADSIDLRFLNFASGDHAV